MMKKKVFISYDFSDHSFKGEVEKWLKEAGVKTYSKNKKDLTPQNTEAFEKEIKKEILTSSLVLILFGNTNHNKLWVNYEVAVAKSKEIPTFCMELPGRIWGAPDEAQGFSCIEYSQSALTKLLRYHNIIK